MKKILLFMLAFCLLLTGCGKAGEKQEAEITVQEQASAEVLPGPEADSEAVAEPEAPVNEEPAATFYPLPDTVMDNLSDAILSVSMEEGGAYVDDTGKMQMKLKIYSYDIYDMVDISMLKEGDILVTHAGEVQVETLARNEGGSVSINGGLFEGGFDLVTEDNGIFFERGYNDAKNWYEVGEVTIPVSDEFVYYDNSDLNFGEKVYYAGSFLVGEVTDYHFYPLNTTVRVENGQLVEMYRVYIP